MSGHAKGPWAVRDEVGVEIYQDWKVFRGAFPRIASVDRTQDQVANAHLIAAAPELLDALVNLRKCIMETRGSDATAALLAADAAIAKAKGEKA